MATQRPDDDITSGANRQADFILPLTRKFKGFSKEEKVEILNGESKINLHSPELEDRFFIKLEKEIEKPIIQKEEIKVEEVKKHCLACNKELHKNNTSRFCNKKCQWIAQNR